MTKNTSLRGAKRRGNPLIMRLNQNKTHPYPSLTKGGSKRVAFTLAETLITLGIIGVVAAITIPNLIANHKKLQTVTKLKNTYSIMSQAVKMAELEYGTTETWDYSLSADNFYKKYLRPYLKITNEYVDNSKVLYYNLNSNKVNNFGFQYANSPKVILANGSMIAVSSKNGGDCKAVYVDINGFAKPNKVGNDIFYFAILPKYGFTVYGYRVGGALANDSFGNELIKREVLIKDSHYASCNKKRQGIWCAALIFIDGWQIKKDYPW